METKQNKQILEELKPMVRNYTATKEQELIVEKILESFWEEFKPHLLKTLEQKDKEKEEALEKQREEIVEVEGELMIIKKELLKQLNR